MKKGIKNLLYLAVSLCICSNSYSHIPQRPTMKGIGSRTGSSYNGPSRQESMLRQFTTHGIDSRARVIAPSRPKRSSQPNKNKQKQCQAQEQRESIAQAKRDRKVAYKKQIGNTLEQRQTEIEACYQEYGNATQTERITKRYQALGAHVAGTDSWTEKNYTLSAQTRQLIADHALKATEYATLYGNQIQHVMHSEFMQILEGTAEVRSQHESVEGAKEMSTTLTLFADAGQKHSHAGYIDKAFSLADFCWQLLDITQTYLKRGGKCMLSALQFEHDCSVAVLKGAWKGSKGFLKKCATLAQFLKRNGYRLLYPKQAIRELAPKVQACAQQIADWWCTMAEQAELYDNTEFALYVERIFNIRSPEHEVAYQAVSQRLADQNAQAMQAVLENIAHVCLTRDGFVQGIEKGSELAAEMALSWATGKAIGHIAQAGANAFANALRTMSDIKLVGHMPTTLGTMQAYIVLEATELTHVAAAAEAAGVAFGKGGNVLAKLGPVGSGASRVAGKDSRDKSLRNDSSSSLSPESNRDVLDATKKITDEELVDLSKSHDGLREHKGRPLKFRFKHILEGNPLKKGKVLGGLHHDLLGYLRKQNLIRNIVMQPDGFYTAEVYFNGKWVKKSFFPENWSMDQVFKSIIKAYDNSRVVHSDGIRTRLLGRISNNREIFLVIEDASGEIVTSHPWITL